MLLLKASNIKKYFGDRLILEIDDFSIYTGDKIGIVGANGAGKSTLLNILSGDLETEQGKVIQYGTLSYATQFTEADDLCRGKESYDQKLLKELKVKDKVQQGTISGGEETRLKLADAFGKQGHILFLDEPTANLDMKGSNLLQEKLKMVETLLIISHDRALLDEVCTAILEVADGTMKLYPGNYSEYERLKEADTDRQRKEYEAYVNEKRRLEAVYTEKKRMAEAAVRLPKGMSPREAKLIDLLCVSGRNHDGKQKSLNRVAESVKKRIDHLEVQEKPKESPKIYLNFNLTNPPENKILIEGREIDFSYGSHEIFHEASFVIPNHKKIAIIGPNGAGKTTLLNLIKEADQLREIDDKIRIVPKAVLGVLYQKLEHLNPDQTVLENAMKDSVQMEVTVRGILAGFLFQAGDLSKKVEVLSGGEKMKLGLAKLLVSNANVLLLDEPTNYLDVPSIIALQNQVKDYEGTILFVSHDKKFVNETADGLLVIEQKKIINYDGNLSQYEEELKDKQKMRKAKKEKLSTGVNIDSDELMRLELRMIQLLAELGVKRNENRKEDLEREYQEVLLKLKSIKSSQ